MFGLHEVELHVRELARRSGFGEATVRQELRKLTSLLSGVSDELGREINPHIMTRTEYRKRKTNRDHFVTKVLDGERLFVVGGEDEFEAVGK